MTNRQRAEAATDYLAQRVTDPRLDPYVSELVETALGDINPPALLEPLEVPVIEVPPTLPVKIALGTIAFVGGGIMTDWYYNFRHPDQAFEAIRSFFS